MNNQINTPIIGFIGLGQMGEPMAMNLVKAGHQVFVFDIDSKKAKRIVEAGGMLASSPLDVAEHARIVMLMVETTEQVESVIWGKNGLVHGAVSGDVIICMSTVNPQKLQEMEKRLSEKGIALIDAPVTGLPKGAEDGTLKALVGGSSLALERARFALESITSKIIHVGACGSGTAMKLINNMLFQANRVLIAEALALGAKAGLDPKRIYEIVSDSTGNSAAFQYCAPRVIARNFDGVRMEITYKDLELQTQFAKSLKMPMFMVPAAQQVFQMARASGYGQEDGVAVVKIYESFTGVEVTPHS
ncbi:NAD(P)-dependent oxidoreductase [Advenella mimigardefordensis]|uniref:Putative NAD-binding 6-phosphopgluconate dehydrogenase n=1 Tax=Advenella mimigardefordensis (strain DSM 17166 / LMG 22922 / DPN7) TaxID=1247726 RepID=W0PG93_ADVMD|nr:NAD(P)-dependent oxidoreductase [Advenella mimigardefordensis]AHG64123.1 putative NAD-binding 6-phosphopgluconate dehydrogenase [Advenella mimigardefordensis DPN7]